MNVKFANSCKEKSGRLGIWTNVLRRKANNDFDYEFNNYFTNRLSEKYLKRFKGKNYFTNSYYISLVLRYEHDLEDAIAELEQLIQNYMIGFSIYEPSVLSAYKLIEGREIVKPEIDPDDDEDDIAEKKRLLDLYENQGVLYSQVFEFWSELLGREKKRIPVLGYPATELISNTNLHFGYEVLEIRSESKTVYASNYDLKAYPEECELGLFDNAILSLPVEFTLTQSFTSLTNTAAIDLIDQQLNKLQSVGDSATHQTDDIKNAKAYIQTGELALGQFHAAITVFGDSQKQAIMNGVAVSNSFINSGGIIWTKSTLSAPYTFFSQMPSAGFLPRPMPKSTRNLASTFSLHNFSVGKESGNPIADGSAVIPLQTDSSSLYNFNFHYSAPNRD
ncbi:cagE, TrbE, VirB, component of type IV transporter system family protein, partial [Acinetobacter baumannii 1406589]|uniref:VirB4 family type IV secretion/conjugal transfer ATPase n=1 Tax=Acinetobacter baumannii TaxID=470 RepID=UPI00044BED33